LELGSLVTSLLTLTTLAAFLLIDEDAGPRMQLQALPWRIRKPAARSFMLAEEGWLGNEQTQTTLMKEQR
jgi:hypothetical protein